MNSVKSLITSNDFIDNYMIDNYMISINNWNHVKVKIRNIDLYDLTPYQKMMLNNEVITSVAVSDNYVVEFYYNVDLKKMYVYNTLDNATIEINSYVLN
jgi:hypothetical protein